MSEAESKSLAAKQIWIPVPTLDWYKEEASKRNMSTSAYINLVLYNHKQNLINVANDPGTVSNSR